MLLLTLYIPYVLSAPPQFSIPTITGQVNLSSHLVFGRNRNSYSEKKYVALSGDAVPCFEEVPEFREHRRLFADWQNGVEFRAEAQVPVFAAKSGNRQGNPVFGYLPLGVISHASVYQTILKCDPSSTLEL